MSIKTCQPYVQQLPDLTFTLATTQVPQTIQLKELDKVIARNKFAHLLGFTIEIELTPTFTTNPTMVGHNACLSDVEFYDGSDMLFKGNGNDMRMFERMEHGRSVLGEPINAASTVKRVITRKLPVGPARFCGSPVDFAIPCAELAEGGYLKFTPGVLTDVSADTTAGSMIVHVGAILAPFRTLRIGPKYQRQVRNNTGSGLTLNDEALYAFLAAINGSSYDAFTAADWSKIQISTTRNGRVVPNVDAELLSRAAQCDFMPGSLDQVKGEQRDDTGDVAQRIVNVASATALAAATADLQMMIWSPPMATLSSLHAEVEKGDGLKIEFSGAQGANGSFLYGRFLPHERERVERRVKRAGAILGVSAGSPVEKTKDGMRLQAGRGVPSNLAKYMTYDVAVSG